MSTAQGELGETKSQLESTQAALEGIKTELETAQAELDKTKQQLEATGAELNNTQAQLQTTQGELTDTQAQLATSQSEHAQLKTQQGETSETLEKTSTELNQAQATLGETQTALTSAKETLEQTQAELKSTQADLGKAQEQLQTTRAELTTSQEEVAKTSEAMQKMSQEMAGMQTSLSSARGQLQEREDVERQRDKQLQTLRNQASAELQEAIENGSVVVEPQVDGLLLRVGGNVLFRPGQANIRREGRATLDAITEFLQAHPDYKARVEGHTDNIPIGSAKSLWPTNWELSTARASAAVRYFESQGIDTKRLSVGGYSFHQPLDTNETREGRARNRRIEIVLVPSATP